MGQRRQYRVDSAEVRDIEVAVEVQESWQSCGQVLDLSADGAGVSLRLASSVCPALAVGNEVRLRFTSALLMKPLVVPATVMRRTDGQDCRRYGFRFTNAQQFERQLPPQLYTLFNRRRSVRVKPDAHAPIEVTLECSSTGLREPAEVVDISAVGVGLRVAPQVEAALAAVGQIRIHIRLPGSREPLDLWGSICQRRLAGTHIVYGIDFDLERSDDSNRQEDAIVAFVMERQRAQRRAPGAPAHCPTA